MPDPLHPFEAILTWYNSLPPDFRKIVALLVLVHLPDFEVPEDMSLTDDSEACFRRWIALEQTHPATIVGKALIFRAIVDFTCRNFFFKERQESIKNWNLGFREHLLQKEDYEFAEKVEHMVEQMPLRNAHWLKAAESWQQLCMTDISDVALELYKYNNHPKLF